MKQEIYQHSDQWNQALYHLQLMSGRPSLKIINLFKYQHSNSNHNYASQIDSLVDITDFKRSYKEKVFNKTIPLQDVVFFCGHINVQTQSMMPSKIFTYLMCKVGLGRIGTFEDAKYETDSIYIEPERQEDPFHYSFLVKSHKQYEVKYEVSFKIGDENEFINSQIRCSICQNQQATLYCVQERMYFCEDCARNHHVQLNNSKSKFKHDLQKLNRINTLPLCENHSIRNQFYCLTCQKYVCSVCCQKGLHSQNHEHIVKPIQFLYEQKRQNNDILPTQPQEKLQKLLANSSNRSLEIQANYEAVKKKLMKEFDKALNTLQKLFKDKLIRVRSDEIQLNMINHKIQWAKAFIKIQQRQLKPVHYFKLQSRFQSELRRLTINNYENAFVIEPDLAAQANILVGNKQLIDSSKPFASGRSQSINKQMVNTPNKSRGFIGKRQHSLLIFDPKRQPPSHGELSLLLQNSNLTFFTIASSREKQLNKT